MHITRHSDFETLDQYMRRARQLRSEAAVSVFASLGRVVLAAVERAFVRPHRMTRVRGCHCDA